MPDSEQLERAARALLQLLDAKHDTLPNLPDGSPQTPEYQAGWRSAFDTIRESAAIELLREALDNQA